MTLKDALAKVQSDTAAKIPSWRGYVYKVMEPLEEYSASETYEVGNRVFFEGHVYECIWGIDTPEAFTSSKWKQTNQGYEILFKENDNPEVGSVGSDGRDFGILVSFTATYPTTPQYGAVIKAKGLSDTYGTFSGEQLTLDGSLFSAMLSSDWFTGPKADFEAARTGAQRW